MKKINSIWFGTTMIKWGIIFVFIIPFFIWIIAYLFALDEVYIFIKPVVAIGTFILVTFGVILIIELNQDKRIDLQHQKNKISKIRLSGGLDECQNCGNRKIHKCERYCSVCCTNLKKNYKQE
jgi:uncharacterized paraquat-inducible protein A